MVLVVARFDLPDRTLWIAERPTAIEWAGGSVISAHGGLLVKMALSRCRSRSWVTR